MSVEFNEGSDISKSDLRAFAPLKTAGMIKFLMNKGIVKDEAGANKVLIGVAALFFIVSIYFFFF